MIDTSGMSEGKRAAFELAEQARETRWQGKSFVRNLFLGKVSWEMLVPFPNQSGEDQQSGQGFLDALKNLLENRVDANAIDESGIIPQEIIDELKAMGAFGIKIPKKYGGLELSQSNYVKAFILIGSHCSNLSTILSVHQSVGVPQPLMLFGNEEQKQKYLPRVAAGEISAFALTESGVGSDPARMETEAHLSEDGEHYIIQGEKLWCSNGPIAGVMIVTAKTGKSITAFIVETDTPGLKLIHHCKFMGLKALQNGVMRFDNVKVPKENVLLAEGKGLKVALTTLNTGRLAIAASNLGMAKQALRMAKHWSQERVQWGSPIAKHDAIAAKLDDMATRIFAMEAMMTYTAIMADQKESDFRLEAAMCKMVCTESAWICINHAMQIFGGRGYETVASLKSRGEKGFPIERFLRDSRITTIFEGSSEIMRLLIAREALDWHFNKAKDVLSGSLLKKGKAAIKILPDYAKWYTKLFIANESPEPSDFRSAEHWKAIDKNSRKLAKALFKAMAKHKEALEKKQIFLHHAVDIGTELFTQACSLAYGEQTNQLNYADRYCKNSQQRITEAFQRMKTDKASERDEFIEQILKDTDPLLEKGIADLKI